MGGIATLKSYGITARTPRQVEAQAGRIPVSHREFLMGMPLVVDLTVLGTSYWIIHAGVPAVPLPEGLTPAEVVPWLAANKPDSLLWPRNPPEEALPVDRPVIMGHMPQPEPVDLGHVIAVDTGCGTLPPYELTALLLPERRFLRV
jgi:serine/threonine protein phosphatase 1